MRELISKIKKHVSKGSNLSTAEYYVFILDLRKAGFTLLEVMIALAITGGLLVTLIYTLDHHLGVVGRHETVTVATFLAREKISELETAPQKKEGEFPAPYSDYSYSTDIRQSSSYGMSEISVAVRKGTEAVRLSKLIPK